MGDMDDFETQIGVRVLSKVKTRLETVAKAMQSEVGVKVGISDVARRCIDKHLPVMERLWLKDRASNTS